jgi:hypothetical protein
MCPQFKYFGARPGPVHEKQTLANRVSIAEISGRIVFAIRWLTQGLPNTGCHTILSVPIEYTYFGSYANASKEKEKSFDKTRKWRAGAIDVLAYNQGPLTEHQKMEE